MKKLLLLVVALGALGGAAYVVLSGMTPIFRTEEHALKTKTLRFFECVKFKEFGEAAAFHNEQDREKADIPKMLEDLFKIPPEYLDVQDVQIMFADVDSEGRLGKVKTRCVVHVLNTEEVRKPEVILYWKKENGEWYLKLRSTLERGRLDARGPR